jgi:solute carrier family 25 aspartate/glutamate transporter 12/13
MDILERIIREATAKSKDGRIDQEDFLNHCASATRYSLFTPMEVSIIFHFAGGAGSRKRLALIDFASLLDPRWKATGIQTGGASALGTQRAAGAQAQSLLSGLAHSAYNFGLGGIAGCFGATMVYPIDLGQYAAYSAPPNW